MRITFFLFVPIILGSVSGYVSNKTYEGYPTGFLPDCPGSMKPAVISRKNLKYLEIHISGVKAMRKQRNKYTYDNMGDMAKDPTMDWSKPTLLYVGGYMDKINFPLGPTVERFYKMRGYNVWILDCFKFMLHEYPVAVRYMFPVGLHTAEMIANLTASNVGFDPKNFEMAGFSMGAQTMSFIAKSYYNITGIKIKRITGIDPSGLCFRNRGPEGRIDEDDADNVDIYNTNIDGWGSPVASGHVNFYFNGGEHQPGSLDVTKCDVRCSHYRGYFIFLQASVYDKEFIGVKCKSVQEARYNKCYENQPIVWNVAGPNTDFSNKGIFYVPTTNKPPYFIGKKGLIKGNDGFTVFTTKANKDDILYIDEK